MLSVYTSEEAESLWQPPDEAHGVWQCDSGLVRVAVE